MHKAMKSALMFKPHLLDLGQTGSGDLAEEGLPDGQAPSTATETGMVGDAEIGAAVILEIRDS